MTEELNPAGAIDRRGLLKGAAWSAPIIALAVATPLAAASTAPAIHVDLWSDAFMPLDAPDGTVGGQYNYFTGPRWLTYRFSYGNNGPDTLPTGAFVSIDLPFAALWNTATMEIVEDPTGANPTFIGSQPMPYDGAGTGPAFNYGRWTYMVNREVAPGESFTLTYRVWLTDATIPASDHYRSRCRSAISVASTGAIEDSPLTNSGYSAAFTMYNTSTAVENA
ncbi:MAG TPA: hypothetical protein DIW46_13515 [Microbacterium sp.]|nr:hypothetical protein [Microbacterium sp.]